MKKKVAALALVVLLLVAAVVGGTLAYFTDTDSATNTFTVGNVDIELDEAAVSYEGGNWVAGTERVQSNTYEKVYPGAVIPKDPTVHNVGSNSAYVRVKVNIDPGFNLLTLYGVLGGDTTPDAYPTWFKAFFGNSIGSDWVITDPFDSSDLGDWFFGGRPSDITFELTYTKILEAGESTSPVFTEITLLPQWEHEDFETFGIDRSGFKVDVVAEAIQADSFDDYEEAFAAFDAQA